MEQSRTFALCLLLAFLGQHVSPSAGARGKNRGADRTVTPAPRGSGGSSKSAANAKGKFAIRDDNMRCTWAARDVADSVRLTVQCQNPAAGVTGGVTELRCQYQGKPQQCRGYQSDPRGFWKQVGRAFKKLHGKVCRDGGALLRAGMCKRAPRDAHFQLDVFSSAASAQSGQPRVPHPPPPPPPPAPNSSPAPAPATAGPAGVAPTTCTGRADVRQRAAEHCSDAWASLCAFLFSVVQSDEC